MKKWLTGVLLSFLLTVPAFGSETFYDVYGTVSEIKEWPIYLGTQFQGYIKTITVNGQAYPLVSKPNVFRATNYPAMYPKVPASFSDVQTGRLVNLRLNGHSVIEVVIER